MKDDTIEITDDNAVLIFSREEGMTLISNYPFNEIDPSRYPDHLKAVWALYNLPDHVDIMHQIVLRIFGENTGSPLH